ncbi:Multi antimicrobial extrusion protein (Na(+)/drug antiporter), MATE family of MDR efflux pump [Lachnospiraceae bacterium TWA4]|nr:Multi antimicrobial extrusion protein (Na(+)/drug antiporter), MATE family of MDR efflux pump [Lachnospiraceae bacterium TWA4]
MSKAVGTKEKRIFEEMPIRKAVVSLAVPTVISQLIVLVYNMADTWFIGQTRDPYQVAAVTVCYPIFMLLNAIANLFGIGGGSLISRLLGRNDYKNAGKVATFTLWASGLFTLVYSAVVFFAGDYLLRALGTDEGTFTYASDYLFWTMVVGGFFTVLNLVIANLVRAEGGAKIASIGMSIGGILNMILDPIFIFVLGLNVAGAAIATGLSNVISLVFLMQYYVRTRKNSAVKATVLPQVIDGQNLKELLSIGTPAALTILLAAISNSVLLNIMSAYSSAAISGVGVMQKVEIIPFQIAQGISSGVLPLVAYNYAAGKKQRMRDAIRFALSIELVIAVISLITLELFASSVVGFFVPDASTIEFGSSFLRLRILALPFITVEFTLIAVFQGIGGAKQAFVLSLLRKGIIDLPLMILANRIWPMYGVMLVQPFMELLGGSIAVWMYLHLHKKQIITETEMKSIA